MNEKQFNELVREIRNPKCFNSLYEYYFPKIVAHIYFKFRRSDLGEDVAQDFFTKLIHKNIDCYIRNPNAWVYTVCDNIAKDILKSEKLYKSAFVDLEANDADDTTFEIVLFGEYKRQLNELDDETRQIIIMKFYEGFSLKEISEAMKLNYNTVRQKFSRGVKKLKKRNIRKNK